MDLGLQGRVAVVAAGSKGLGRAVVEALAREGARVVTCARGGETLERAVGVLRAGGLDVTGVVADVSRPDGVQAVIREAESRLGPVEILVTNSGGPRSGRFEDLSDADWDDGARLLLQSPVWFVRAVLPGMKARRWGRILFITSIAAKQPVDGLMLSNSLRAGVTGFARTLANEVAGFGVTVNTVLPGYTRTERVEELAVQMAAREGTTPEAIRARWEREIPIGRLAAPEEFAALVAFLASERAGYITGCALPVDGGWIRSLL